MLKVPEDYNKPQGSQVELPFIIFKAGEREDSTMPLVVAGGGGPGGGLGIAETDWYAFSSSVWMSWYNSTIQAGRDLVLIDNRGVGSSVPSLDCDEVEDAAINSLNKALDNDELVALTKTSYAACKERLEQQGIDISQYHVINAARDLERLRIGLGVEQLNVYGVSYGSRVSLVYEQLFPDSARALILDGIYPQSTKTYEYEPRHNAEAIMRVIDKCNRDNHCYSRFGHDLDVRFAEYLEKLSKSPVTVSVTNPVDYKPFEVLVTPQVFFDSIYSAIYDETVIAYIPKYLHAIMEGNTDYLAELVRDYFVVELTTNSLDEGAYASYACFDEIPFADFSAARDQLKAFPFQHYSNELVFDYVEAMCAVWGVPRAPLDFKVPYSINTPVLIYSGELDPVTPADLAKPVMNNARKWWATVWPNIAHGVMYSSYCADWTAEAFLSDPESNPFIYECSEEKPRFIFAVR